MDSLVLDMGEFLSDAGKAVGKHLSREKFGMILIECGCGTCGLKRTDQS